MDGADASFGILDYAYGLGIGLGLRIMDLDVLQNWILDTMLGAPVGRDLLGAHWDYGWVEYALSEYGLSDYGYGLERLRDIGIIGISEYPLGPRMGQQLAKVQR